MTDTPLQLALRELRAIFTNPRALSVIGVVIVVLGLSGPFQTFEELAFGPRLAYWAALTICTFAIGSLCGTWALHALQLSHAPLWVHVLGGGIAAGVPVTLVVLAISLLTFQPYPISLTSLLTLLGYCVTIATAVSLIFTLFLDRKDQAPTPSANVRLLDRIALPQRGDLISLSMSDHYVEVTTTKGRTLLLLRLSDAIAEADTVPGVQLHRSHWVALDAVTQVTRVQGKVHVETSDGRKLPVSRGFMSKVRGAGLIVE